MASTVGKQWKIVDEAMRAFLVALSRVEPSAPTWSSGWSAHEVTAHVAAAAQERADLIEEHLAGHPARATRTWQEREPPFRALPGEQLRDRLVLEAGRFERAVADMVASPPDRCGCAARASPTCWSIQARVSPCSPRRTATWSSTSTPMTGF
jgi:hypothetical protein